MEHRLLHLIHDLAGPAPDALTTEACALLAHGLLMAPYFQDGHAQTWQLSQTRNGLGLVQYNRGDWRNRHPVDLYGEMGGRVVKHAGPVDTAHIEATTIAKAGELLRVLWAQEPGLLQMLTTPTPEQLAARQQITLELLDPEALDARLAQVLGSTYRLDGSLGTQGIEYHTSPSWNEGHMRYVLAHNGQEVAGILGLSDFRPWTYGVNYLAVAPTFRQQGVARRLFGAAIDECVKDGRVLVRTAPGEFAEERPAIPAGFDRQSQTAPVLHVQANSTLMGAVGRALERLPYDEVFRLYKPLCDQFDVGGRRDRWHDPELNAAIAALDSLLPGTPQGQRGLKP